MLSLGTILRLGRVSNLPTVWTNALAGMVLVGAAPDPWAFLMAGLALSLFYEGGMWLNDAFDAEIDAREKTDRPIPKGEVSRATVFVGGFTILGLGVGIAFLAGTAAGLTGLALAAAVIAYDALHKRTALAPMLMGITRFLSYVLAATAADGGLEAAVLAGAAGLFAYVIGLTYAAKQEAYDRIGAAWPLGVLALPLVYLLWVVLEDPVALTLWLGLAAVVAFALRRLFRRAKGDVAVAVVTLIAGISLYDAALIAASGQLLLGLAAAAGFVLTLALQRVVSGT